MTPCPVCRTPTPEPLQPCDPCVIRRLNERWADQRVEQIRAEWEKRGPHINPYLRKGAA